MSAESEGLMDSTNATSNATTNLQSAINSLSSIIQSMNNILSTYQANISKLASATNAFASATQQQTSVLRENEDQTGNNEDANSSLNSTLNTVSATGLGLTGVYNAINTTVLVATDLANGFARQQLSVWAANIAVIGSTNTLVQAQAMAALAQSQGGAAAQNAAAQNLGYAQTQLKVSQQNVTLAQTAQTTAGIGDIGALLSSFGNAATGILAVIGAFQILNGALATADVEAAGLGVDFAGIGAGGSTALAGSVGLLSVLGLLGGVIAVGAVDVYAYQTNWNGFRTSINSQLSGLGLLASVLGKIVEISLLGWLIGVEGQLSPFAGAIGPLTTALQGLYTVLNDLNNIHNTIGSSLSGILGPLNSTLGGIISGEQKQLTTPTTASTTLTNPGATVNSALGLPTPPSLSQDANTIVSGVNSLISFLTHAASGLTIASIIPKAQLGGTITSGGLINVHAGEVIAPAGGATGATSLGGVTININVNTQADLAALSSNVTKGISRAMQNATLGKGAYS